MKRISLVYILLLGASCAQAEDVSSKLTVYLSGNPFASETYSLQNTNGNIRLTGSGQADLGPIKIDIGEFTVEMNAKYEPVAARVQGSTEQAHLNVTARFENGKATAEIDSTQGTRTRETSIHPDDVILNPYLPLFPLTVFGLRARLDTAEPQRFHAYIMGQAEVAVTLTYKGQEDVQFADRKQALHHLTILVLPGGSRPPLRSDLWVDNDRRLVKIAAQEQNMEAYQQGYRPKISAVQAATGTLQGKVVDASGAPLAGAWVTIKNPKTGDSDYVLTDPSGHYHLGPVALGIYTLEVAMQGYRTFHRDSFIIGPAASLDIVLPRLPEQ